MPLEFPKKIEIYDTEAPSLTWFLDTKLNTLKRTTDGLEAVKQSVYISLHTERYKYKIYTPQYGSELKTLLGKNPDYVFSEAKRIITDALKPDIRITKVYDFSMSDNTIYFTIDSTFGTAKIQTEVIT